MRSRGADRAEKVLKLEKWLLKIQNHRLGYE